MATAIRQHVVRRVEDAILFTATVLLAFWAFSDRSPPWLTAVYAVLAFALAVVVRRLVCWVRARHDAGAGGPPAA